MGLNETLLIFRGLWCPNCGERRDDSARREGMCCSRKDRQGRLSSEPGTRYHNCSVSDTKLLLSIEQWCTVQFGYVRRVLDCALFLQMPISYKHHQHFPNLFFISQILSFSTYDDIQADSLLSKMKDSKACVEGRLAVWEVIRAPKRFHALFSASWRRYIYLFPLNDGAIAHMSFH